MNFFWKISANDYFYSIYYPCSSAWFKINAWFVKKGIVMRKILPVFWRCKVHQIYDGTPAIAQNVI